MHNFCGLVFLDLAKGNAQSVETVRLKGNHAPVSIININKIPGLAEGIRYI